MTLNQVSDYYNRHVKQEDKRLDVHVFELPVTLHFIEKYVRSGAYILDVACGTGRYAQVLMDKGYKMALGDISEKNIELTKKRVGDHPNLIKIATGNALSFDLWDIHEWDAILLLGPMYHFIKYQKRMKLLKKSYQYLKKGGFLFTAFMTRTGALVYGLKHNPAGIRSPNGAKKLWETGTDNDFVEGTEWFTHAYFSHPEEINPMIMQSGLKPLHLAGVEGIFGERFEEYHKLPGQLQDEWRRFIIEYCEDPRMICHSKHLLSVSGK